MNYELPYEKHMELVRKIIQLLGDEGCTVSQARSILVSTSRMISGSAPVQPLPPTD